MYPYMGGHKHQFGNKKKTTQESKKILQNAITLLEMM